MNPKKQALPVPELSIITVNYGRSDRVRLLYDTLKRFPPQVEWEWIVIDNASKRRDGVHLQRMVADDPHVHVVLLDENTGFGRGNDHGIRLARGNYIALVNPDIELGKDTFEPLLAALQDTQKHIKIALPVLQDHRGNVLENAWGFPSLWGLAKRRLFGRPHLPPNAAPNKERPVAWGQGSFLVFSRDWYTKLGGFDHRFFLFFEDTDLCRRTWNAGGRVVQIPASRAFHGIRRLSGKGIFRSLKRRTFWVHLYSAGKYFFKYSFSKKPTVQ